jgi:hypothetical protein
MFLDGTGICPKGGLFRSGGASASGGIFSVLQRGETTFGAGIPDAAGNLFWNASGACAGLGGRGLTWTSARSFVLGLPMKSLFR